MRLSESGLALLREFEGFRERAYPDPGSRDGKPVTIGYGSTRYADGRPIQLGDTITREQADELLRREVAETETAVAGLVTVPLTQPQFDALTSLSFNVGIGAFSRSTLLRMLNAGDYAGAADQFLRWNKNDGAVMEGLTRRRQRERAMFLMGPQSSPSDTRPNDALAGFDLPNLHTAPPAIDTSPKPVDSTPRSKPMAPVLAALLPSLVSLIPELGKLFGTGSAVSDRNLKAAEKVAEVVVAATQAPNLQGAVEQMQANPDARNAARLAVTTAWYDLIESGGGGIAGAREYNVRVAQTPAWRMPAVWVSGALLLLVFMVVGSVLWGPNWKDDIKLQVVTAVLTIIGMVGSFWLGTSASSQRKTDLMAEK